MLQQNLWSNNKQLELINQSESKRQWIYQDGKLANSISISFSLSTHKYLYRLFYYYNFVFLFSFIPISVYLIIISIIKSVYVRIWSKRTNNKQFTNEIKVKKINKNHNHINKIKKKDIEIERKKQAATNCLKLRLLWY